MVKQDFGYTPTELKRLVDAISIDRFYPYLKACDFDLRRAVSLYEWNRSVGSAFYELLQDLEVALRHACSIRLAEFFGDEWPNAVTSSSRYRSLHQAITTAEFEARRSVKEKTDTVKASMIVAKLSFGFWTALFGKAFEHSLWTPVLHKAFPHYRELSGRGLSRPTTASNLHALRVLRNKVAHHESILREDLLSEFERILFVAGWMSPDLANWMRTSSSFLEIAAARPT